MTNGRSARHLTRRKPFLQPLLKRLEAKDDITSNSDPALLMARANVKITGGTPLSTAIALASAVRSPWPRPWFCRHGTTVLGFGFLYLSVIAA